MGKNELVVICGLYLCDKTINTPPLTLFSNSTLLHSFVIFPVSETIFGMSGCFPVSQGQEMKDLTASSGRKATRGCQCSFSAQVRLKNSHEYKKLFLSLVK